MNPVQYENWLAETASNLVDDGGQPVPFNQALQIARSFDAPIQKEETYMNQSTMQNISSDIAIDAPFYGAPQNAPSSSEGFDFGDILKFMNPVGIMPGIGNALGDIGSKIKGLFNLFADVQAFLSSKFAGYAAIVGAGVIGVALLPAPIKAMIGKVLRTIWNAITAPIRWILKMFSSGYRKARTKIRYVRSRFNYYRRPFRRY